MGDPLKIQITPNTSFDLNGSQKSLLGNVARRTDLKKEDVLDKVITAGLRAIMENGWTFSLPLSLRVEEPFQKNQKETHPSNKQSRKKSDYRSTRALMFCWRNPPFKGSADEKVKRTYRCRREHLLSRDFQRRLFAQTPRKLRARQIKT